MSENPQITVVIPAGGSGLRMNIDTSKLLLELGGKPVICHSVELFLSDPEIGTIVIAASDKVLPTFSELFGKQQNVHLIKGGRTRQQSVWNGLQYLKEMGAAAAESRVLIHDAARPGVTMDIVTRIKQALGVADAAIPVLPVKDSIKRVTEDGVVLESLTRTGLVRIQTPQGFRFDSIYQAHKNLLQSEAVPTDDAQLLEGGTQVVTVNGSERNLKLTTFEDYDYLKSIWSPS